MRVRAVVLAAGLATRMRPLTDAVPKALLPVAGKPVLAHTLERLAAAGCESIAVNLHHRGGAIRDRFGGAHAGIPLHWSEERELLGTLGALGRLRPFLAPADLAVVVNGDSLCRWPLEPMIRRHRGSGARVTLLFAKRADPESFGGGVGLDLEGRVVTFRGPGEEGAVDRRAVFAGLHLISPELLRDVEERPADIIDGLYEPLLARGEVVRGLETGRPWHDLGTPRRYLEAVLDLVRGRGPLRALRRGRVVPGAVIEPGAAVRGSVIEAGARVEAEARIEHSVVLPGARVSSGCRVQESIVGFGAELPPGASIERRLITPERPGAAAAPGDSVVGGLVLSPLERA